MLYRSRSAALSVRVAGIVALVCAMCLALVGPARAQTEVTPARAGGVDRYATAVIAANEVVFPAGTDNAVVASGENFPDALAASALAAQADAALLLTRQGELPQVTAVGGLGDLGVENVYVLGGEAAVSQDVVDQIDTAERDYARIGGADRYETAALVAGEVARLGNTLQVGGEPAAFLATGENFADAVTASAPAAAGVPAPVLLTGSESLRDSTREAIEDLDIGYMFVIGGSAAISSGVVAELDDLGVQVQRIAGDDRQETATEVARAFVESGRLDGSVVTLARGDDFPDALTGGTTAAATSGPVLLTEDPNTLGEAAADYLANPSATISVVRAMGGDDAITPGVLAQAVEIAEGDGASAPQSWILAPQEPLTVDIPEGAAGVADFELLGTDDQPVPAAVALALFSCADVDAIGPDRTFADANGDGLLDDVGTSDTGQAAIAVVNGVDIPDTTVVNPATPDGGTLSFSVASLSPDCTVPVVWDDENGNGELDLDASDQPVEPYNVGQVTFQ